MKPSVQVRILRNVTEIENLREEWNSLISESSSDCLFLTWEWMTVWWRHLGSARTLHVIEVRDSNRLIGLAPLASVNGRLEFLGTGTVGSDYLDIIASRESEPEVIEAVARSLEATGLNLRFSHIQADSVVHRVAERLRTPGYRVFDRVINVCPFMTLSGHTWESFLSSLGKRHRENVRRRIRKLPGDAAIHRTVTEDDLLKNLPTLIDLHNEGWDRRGGSDALRGRQVQDFHKEFSRLALARGWLRLFVLKIGDRPAAAVYAFSRNGKVLYYQAGVAPEYNWLGLGLVALSLSLRHAIDEGALEYDLLHGDEEYKSLWTRKTRELHVLEAYPLSLKGRLTMHSHRVLRAAKTMARYVIAR